MAQIVDYATPQQSGGVPFWRIVLVSATLLALLAAGLLNYVVVRRRAVMREYQRAVQAQQRAAQLAAQAARQQRAVSQRQQLQTQPAAQQTSPSVEQP